jgi:hypothetical protein
LNTARDSLNGEKRVVAKEKTSRKLNMQPGDAADYEAEARAYFDSLRQPFEQTLQTTRKNHPKLLARITFLIVFIGISVAPFASARVVTFVFHQNTFTFIGQTHSITETAGGIVLWCLIGTMAVGLFLHSMAQEVELKSAVRLLSQHVMVFALSYAIARELESFERTNLPHHRRTAIELWAKLLTYLRWTLEGISTNTAQFHGLPSGDYPVAPCAEHFAKALNWNQVRRLEYDVVVALNSLHSKVSPRLKKDRDYRDLPRLRQMFRGIGNFFYTSIVQSREDEARASWGYGELLRAAEIVNNRLSSIMESQSPQRAPFFSAQMFTHGNIAVAFLAWWIVFQALFVAVVSMTFHFFPALTMNSQAMVAVIAAPVAAAISMVGISRKTS